MPVTLSFWGREENREAVTQHLANHGFKLNTRENIPISNHSHSLPDALLWLSLR